MTRADIIKLAREAGITTVLPAPLGQVESLERFATLVAAAEREECAKVCDDLELPEHYEGTWPSGWSDGTDDCAAAIRARGYET